MIDFKDVDLEDKKWIKPLLTAADMRGCHQNFTNIFAWSKIYHYRVAQIDGYLVVKGILDDLPYYFYPAGPGNIKPILEVMKQDAASSGHEFVIAGLSPEQITELNSIYPEHFEYKEMRDSYDYVYLLDKLVSLSGNSLHSKRNYINRFMKENKNWSFELITSDNLSECWEMNKEWCKINPCDEGSIAEENCAVRRCFNNYAGLGIEGGLIRLEGKVIAYTLGERLNSDTYVIHVEKAFGHMPGAYQMINREFAAVIKKQYPQIVYVNREEDMGVEGLRKAKLSYHPDKMEEKYIGTYFEG
ncbi:hypothetical protein Desaci_2873 [Desulfosporosinus acidiphilus SJ4]|uniref:Phosphatidylglycerol lysyltransferase C-terminal domain-containing protein n=1 Tax=Desulfosporosinus acidiphilus (strain DSM 22704 / JCM 16185 / SJ4) TaxID=646529 RepID=I4D7L1_DESAJ|nr:phosphatidylglycerol lysyltransferase domain-containing protein [Desulfosporosinus acidiphilus]AFM41785.1 hypothetical protein Desaci_2873 [Desulfosporosinus acidiphilus SJ4]